MWQEVAQTKSREMVAISSKDVKDCERIVEEVERWLLSAGSDPCCSNSSALLHRAAVLWCRWGVRPLHFIEIHPCLWCRWGVRPLHFIETHPASKGLVVACRGKMWQEVAQTKKSRGMVAIGSKNVKDCEGIVGEIELCRRVRAEMASECWFWTLLLQFLCSLPQSNSVMVQIRG